MSNVRLPAQRKIKCKACKGTGHTAIDDSVFDVPNNFICDGYEYICTECNGYRFKWVDSSIDIEILALIIKEKIDG